MAWYLSLLQENEKIPKSAIKKICFIWPDFNFAISYSSYTLKENWISCFMKNNIFDHVRENIKSIKGIDPYHYKNTQTFGSIEVLFK